MQRNAEWPRVVLMYNCTMYIVSKVLIVHYYHEQMIKDWLGFYHYFCLAPLNGACLGIDVKKEKKRWFKKLIMNRFQGQSQKLSNIAYPSMHQKTTVNYYILKPLWGFRIENGLWNGQGYIDFGKISMFEQGALFQKEMHLLCT